MALQRGGNDQTIRRITVDVREKAGARRDSAFNGYLDQSLIQKVTMPSVHVDVQVETALLCRMPTSQMEMVEIAALSSRNGRSTSWRVRCPSLWSPDRTQRVSRCGCQEESEEFLSVFVRIFEPLRRHGGRRCRRGPE